jgi:hypothetical protein
MTLNPTAHSRSTPARAIALLCVLCALAVITPATHAQRPFSSNDAADVVALTVCVIDADIRHAAVEQLQRGAARDDVLRAVEKTLTDYAYRRQAERIVNEVWRAQPAVPRPYVAERLERCAAGAAKSARVPAADACYQLTRYARDIFAARSAGVPLARTVESLQALAREQGMAAGGAERLAKLAASVYATQIDPPQFRAGLFYHCITPGRVAP